MPAKSKAQQRFFGMVRAVQKGEMENPSPEVAQAASYMKKKDVKDFASTDHKGLPNKKKTEESFTIDPKAHRTQQRAAKIRNLVKKGSTEGERSAAERKTKGPKMFGETVYQKKLSDKERKRVINKSRMKHGKKWKEFIGDVDAAKNRLRPGEVKKWDKESGRYVSNKD
jgi:hypothetical protein